MKHTVLRAAWTGALACAGALAGCATQPPPPMADNTPCFRPECCDRARALTFEPHRLNCEAIRLRDGRKDAQAEKKIALAIAAAKQAAPTDREAAAEVLCFASADAAQFHEQRGDNDAALAAFKDNVDYCRERFGADSNETAQALYGQANLLLKRNELDQAEPNLKAVLDISRFRGNQALTAFALDASGRLADMRGDRANGRALLNQALQLKTGLFGERSVEVATTCTNIGASYMEAEEDAKGWPWYQRAAAIYAEELGPRNPRYLDVQAGLATSYLQQGRLDDAETIYRDLLPGLAEAYGTSHEHYLVTLNDYAVLAFRRDDFNAAFERFSQALSARRKAVPNSVSHGWTALNTAKARIRQHGCASAKPYRAEARAVLAKLTPKRRVTEMDTAVAEYSRAVGELEQECRATSGTNRT